MSGKVGRGENLPPRLESWFCSWPTSRSFTKHREEAVLRDPVEGEGWAACEWEVPVEFLVLPAEVGEEGVLLGEK